MSFPYIFAILLISTCVFASDDKLCHVCRSTTMEVDKALIKKGSKRSESDVMDILSDICKFASFKVYDYPPPKMVSMCKDVMDTHEENFEVAFQDKSLNVDQLQENICKSFCDGIDTSKKRAPEQPQVFMDGEPVETNQNQAPPSKKKKSKKKKKKKKKNKKKKTKKTKKTKKKSTKKESKDEL